MNIYILVLLSSYIYNYYVIHYYYYLVLRCPESKPYCRQYIQAALVKKTFNCMCRIDRSTVH